MPKSRRYYHKAIAKCVLVVLISHASLLAMFGAFSLVEVDGTAFKLKRHPLQWHQHSVLSNATCNASITIDYTSHDGFFVYPRFTKGPDIELSKMVASQDQNGYLALPRASPATIMTQDTLNSIFKLTDGQLMVSSLLPSNADNSTMYGKVCEVEQDIEDLRFSVPPFTSRSARWRNSSSMISSSSSRTHDRFLCHDGQAWNRGPARQWEIQQSCVSNKIVDILVPKVAGRTDGDILTLENGPGSETIHYCRTSQRLCQDQERSRQIVLLVDYLSNSPRFVLNRADCFWKDTNRWCGAPEKDGRDRSV